MFELRNMYHAKLIHSQDMASRNFIRVPIIGLELAIDPAPPGGIL